MVAPDLYYPFIEVDFDEAVTCVVGANESGKSQLLTALERALSGEGIEAADFCRYSAFFAVDTALRTPQFGLGLVGLSTEEGPAVLAALGVSEAFSTRSLSQGGRQREGRLNGHDGSTGGPDQGSAGAGRAGRARRAGGRPSGTVPAPSPSTYTDDMTDRPNQELLYRDDEAGSAYGRQHEPM